jgi:hypothetical protein
MYDIANTRLGRCLRIFGETATGRCCYIFGAIILLIGLTVFHSWLHWIWLRRLAGDIIGGIFALLLAICIQALAMLVILIFATCEYTWDDLLRPVRLAQDDIMTTIARAQDDFDPIDESDAKVAEASSAEASGDMNDLSDISAS